MDSPSVGVTRAGIDARQQLWQGLPGTGDVAHQPRDFGQRLPVVVGIDVQDPAGQIAIQVIEVMGQLAATLEIQGALQSDHNAGGACQGFGFVFDVAVLDMAAGGCQAFTQPVKQHLDPLHIVSTGHAGDPLDRTVTLDCSCVSTHELDSSTDYPEYRTGSGKLEAVLIRLADDLWEACRSRAPQTGHPLQVPGQAVVQPRREHPHPDQRDLASRHWKVVPARPAGPWQTTADPHHPAQHGSAPMTLDASSLSRDRICIGHWPVRRESRIQQAPWRYGSCGCSWAPPKAVAGRLSPPPRKGTGCACAAPAHNAPAAPAGSARSGPLVPCH